MSVANIARISASGEARPPCSRPFISDSSDGSRHASSNDAAPSPCGGTGATITAAGSARRASSRCSTKPPIEWPMTTGGVPMASIASITSAT